MQLDARKYLLIFGILITLLSASYYNFSLYKPKSTKRVEETKGMKTQETLDIPYPPGSENISYNQSSRVEQAAFQTNKTPEEVQSYYKNVYLDNEWELAVENKTDGSFVSKFKKDNKTATVISSRDGTDNNTMASVEISID